jgi:hypothetical protein
MIAVLCLFVLITHLYLGFSQTTAQIAVSISLCTLLDFSLTLLNSGRVAIPLSGLISGLGLSLLLDAGLRTFPFVFAAVLCISSKHLLKFENKHFYNPTAFALTVISLLNLGSLTPGYQWGGGTTALWIVLSIGTILLAKVRRIVLLSSFILLFLVSAVIRWSIGLESTALAFGVLTGGPFQLFTFFMLPDPRTTPNSTLAQVLFSGGVVAADFVLRWLRIPNTLVLSLFIVDSVVLLVAFCGASFSVHPWTDQELNRSENSPNEHILGVAGSESPSSIASYQSKA